MTKEEKVIRDKIKLILNLGKTKGYKRFVLTQYKLTKREKIVIKKGKPIVQNVYEFVLDSRGNLLVYDASLHRPFKVTLKTVLDFILNLHKELNSINTFLDELLIEEV